MALRGWLWPQLVRPAAPSPYIFANLLWHFGTCFIFFYKKKNVSVSEIHPSKWLLRVCSPLWLITQCHAVSVSGQLTRWGGGVYLQQAAHVAAQTLACLEYQRKTSSEKPTTTLTGQRVYERSYPIDRVQGQHEETDHYSNSWFNFPLTLHEYYNYV